jgi:uncharacterized protein DUF4440
MSRSGEQAMTTQQQILDIVADLEKRLYEGLEESSAEILSEVFSDDLVYVHSQGIAETKHENLVGQQSRFFWHGPVKRVGGETTVYGTDLATTVGPIEMVDYGHGPAYTLHLHQTLVWANENGTWRLVLRVATKARD